MSDVFLSYAAEDRDRIKGLVEAIGETGWSVFWDRTIPLGSTWRRHLAQELAAARCVVVVWSYDSIESDWVSEEAAEAQSRGVLIPVLIDPVEPPLGFRSLQVLDLSGPAVAADSAALGQLAEGLSRLLGPPGPPSAGDEKVPEAATGEEEEERSPKGPARWLVGVVGAIAIVIVLWTRYGTSPNGSVGVGEPCGVPRAEDVLAALASVPERDREKRFFENFGNCQVGEPRWIGKVEGLPQKYGSEWRFFLTEDSSGASVIVYSRATSSPRGGTGGLREGSRVAIAGRLTAFDDGLGSGKPEVLVLRDAVFEEIDADGGDGGAE